MLFDTVSLTRIYSLPSDKILASSKLEEFAHDKIIVVKMMISLLDRAENAVEKGENAGYQHFLLYPQCFLKPSSLESFKVGIVWYTLQKVKAQSQTAG